MKYRKRETKEKEKWKKRKKRKKFKKMRKKVEKKKSEEKKRWKKGEKKVEKRWKKGGKKVEKRWIEREKGEKKVEKRWRNKGHLVIVGSDADGLTHAEVADLGVLFGREEHVTSGQVTVHEGLALQVSHAFRHLVHQQLNVAH